MTQQATIEQRWIPVSEKKPPYGVVVDTKIHDWEGLRNEQSLKLIGPSWYLPDGSMYVYYTPTHWRTIQPPQVNK